MEEKENFENEENYSGDEEPRVDLRRRIFRAVLALLAIAGLLYLSGIYQSFFYQRTPAWVKQVRLDSMVDAETINVPLTLFILSNSGRDEANARRLVKNAGNILEQASVGLVVNDVFVLNKSDEELRLFYENPHEFIRGLPEFSPHSINIFLAGELGGLNGIAFGGINAVAVADYTTVFDFRTLAHEIGHILGLDHVPEDGGRLMYKGANGFKLSPQEIMTARERAEGLFGGL